MATKNKEPIYDQSKLDSGYLFERYVQKYGSERAQGYIDALKVFTGQMNGMFRYRLGPDAYLPHTSTTSLKMLKQLFEEQKNLLEQAQPLLHDVNQNQQL